MVKGVWLSFKKSYVHGIRQSAFATLTLTTCCGRGESRPLGFPKRGPLSLLSRLRVFLVSLPSGCILSVRSGSSDPDLPLFPPSVC